MAGSGVRRATTCSECEAAHYARGLCRKHYARLQRAGRLDDMQRVGWGAVTHGTYFAWRHHKCRCDVCKEWQIGHNAELHDQRQAKREAMGEQEWGDRSRRSKLRGLERKFGFDYATELAKQAGKCAICGETEPRGNGRRLSVDHDHETGEYRALLCMECNLALGHMKDDPLRLIAAAHYLLSHREQEVVDDADIG